MWSPPDVVRLELPSASVGVLVQYHVEATILATPEFSSHRWLCLTVILILIPWSGALSQVLLEMQTGTSLAPLRSVLLPALIAREAQWAPVMEVGFYLGARPPQQPWSRPRLMVDS